MENLPSDLHSYDISLNSQSDALICELKRSEVIFRADIKETDLKSGLVTLAKLKNIIQSNSKITQPNFIIKLNGIFNELTHQNDLVLNIKFSSDFIDFEENIYFREKNAMIEDCNQIKKLNEIVVEQENKIKRLEQIATEQEDKIKCLENKLEQIEDQQFIMVRSRTTYNRISDNLTEQRIMRKNIQCYFDGYGVTITNINDYDIYESLYFPNINVIRKQIEKFCNVKYFRLSDQAPSYNDGNVKYDNHVEEFAKFLNSYLQNGKIILSVNLDFSRDNNQLPQVFNVLKKYTNYKKLIISFRYANFNDFGIKQYCKLNNIEYNLHINGIMIEN
jgi:hypothetical protein